jgi:large subunit ribosomal protein L4
MDIQVYNQQGKETGTMELPKVFESAWNADLVHQVVTSQQANQRPTVAHAKGRGEVRGGGRKPWQQKGTGRARHGSIRSPIWKGGGVTHGPLKERSFKKKINRKMADRALAVVVAAKIRDHELLVLDELSFASSKTKEAVSVFRQLSTIQSFSGILAKPRRSLVLLFKHQPELVRALRNVVALEVKEARNATALDFVNRKFIVAPRASIELLAKRISR